MDEDNDCGERFDFQAGDGHTIGDHWKICARRNHHLGGHAPLYGITNAQRAEDEAQARTEARKFREGIAVTAKCHRRRIWAYRELEKYLQSCPDNAFSLMVPADL